MDRGGTAIVPSHTLVLDATVRYKLLVKKLTPEDSQTGFTNRNAMYQQIEKVGNVTKY